MRRKKLHSLSCLAAGLVLALFGETAGATVHDTWTATGSMTKPRIGDPFSGTWSYTTSMDTPRYWHNATRLSWGAVLITGGLNGYDQLSNVELYLPGSGAWMYQGDMLGIRYQHTATLLPKHYNHVLVTGGKGSS